jgi:hypothetical protein
MRSTTSSTGKTKKKQRTRAERRRHYAAIIALLAKLELISKDTAAKVALEVVFDELKIKWKNT